MLTFFFLRYQEMLKYDHTTLVATVRRLYEMIQELGGWDLDAPETDDYGLPSTQSIAARLRLLSQPENHDICAEMEDHTRQEPRNYITSLESCSASKKGWLDQDSSQSDLLSHTTSPSLTGLDSLEASIQFKLPSPEPLISPFHHEIVQSDQQGGGTFDSIPKRIPATFYLPDLPTFPCQKDVCSMILGDNFTSGWLLGNDFKIPIPTVNPALLQTSMSGSNIYALDGGSQMLDFNMNVFEST
jgi:hypothetical protein